jgi:hypothetical protein
VTTSSAEPDRLEAYPGQLASPDDELTTLAADVDEASAAFTAGAGPYGGAFDAAWGGDLVRGLRDESEHLGGWVAGVGAAFREASTLGIPPEELDNFISKQVGEPTIWEAQQAAEGQAAAEALQTELIALGIDPSTFDPWQIAALDPYDPQFQRVYELMTDIGEQMSNEDFAVGFYDSMDAEGIQNMVGLIDNFAMQRATYGDDDFAWMGSVQDQVLAPFVGGWALASGSVDLTEERRQLVAAEDAAEQQALVRLMSGPAGRYDPEWLADAAEQVLVTGADLNGSVHPGGGLPGIPGWRLAVRRSRARNARVRRHPRPRRQCRGGVELRQPG